MREDPVLECQDCGRVLRHLTPGEAQQVAEHPYNFIFFCAICQKENEDRMLGLCAGCFTMKNLRNGSILCDTCASKGGSREFDPEPYPRKSGPNSLPEE